MNGKLLFLSFISTVYQCNSFFNQNKLKNREHSQTRFVKIIRKQEYIMKNNYNTKLIFAFLGIILLTLISFGFYSISSENPALFPIIKTEHDRKVKTYSFTTKDNGQKIYWTAVIRNGKIESLYKNDEKLSDDEITKYKDIVLEHAKKLDESLASLDEFYFPDSCSYFNSKAFRHQMKELNERMKNFNFNFHFDSENYQKMMEQLHENLEKLKEENFFDDDKWEDLDRKLSDAFKDRNFDFHFNFDFDKLNMSLDKLDLKMKDLKIDMSHLKEKMKALKGFLKDVRAELVKDGYLDENDEDFDLNFTKDKIEVNGKRLPDNLLEKYKKIYKEHFGKEIDDCFRIIN